MVLCWSYFADRRRLFRSLAPCLLSPLQSSIPFRSSTLFYALMAHFFFPLPLLAPYSLVSSTPVLGVPSLSTVGHSSPLAAFPVWTSYCSSPFYSFSFPLGGLASLPRFPSLFPFLRFLSALFLALLSFWTFPGFCFYLTRLGEPVSRAFAS